MRTPSIQLFFVAVGFSVIGCAEAGSGNLGLLSGDVGGGDATTDGSEHGVGGRSQAGLAASTRNDTNRSNSNVGGATNTSGGIGITGGAGGVTVSNAP
ncbi:MAG TPA: hypothetical protein VKP30_05440, partial [Polyangiaceae bacterium]|nr:hypothetical protein [Polyangiaceae bacterium]